VLADAGLGPRPPARDGGKKVTREFRPEPFVELPLTWRGDGSGDGDGDGGGDGDGTDGDTGKTGAWAVGSGAGGVSVNNAASPTQLSASAMARAPGRAASGGLQFVGPNSRGPSGARHMAG
jgi:hypothetical protein